VCYILCVCQVHASAAGCGKYGDFCQALWHLWNDGAVCNTDVANGPVSACIQDMTWKNSADVCCKRLMVGIYAASNTL
jgi:hypothetical protein